MSHLSKGYLTEMINALNKGLINIDQFHDQLNNEVYWVINKAEENISEQVSIAVAEAEMEYDKKIRLLVNNLNSTKDLVKTNQETTIIDYVVDKLNEI